MKKEELNKDNLQKISDYAKQITSGKASYTRFTKEEQAGLARGGELYVEASLLVGTGNSAGETVGNILSKRQQEILVEQLAKSKGAWYENAAAYFDKKYGGISKGSESTVWYDPERGVVIKTKNTYHYPDLEKALDSITLHNTHFPETAQKVIGFGIDENGEFSIIEEQPYIQHHGEKPTLLERHNFAKEHGFEWANDGEDNNYKNYKTELRDLHEDNLRRDEYGNLYAIDTIMRFTNKRQIGNEVVPNEAQNGNMGYLLFFN